MEHLDKILIISFLGSELPTSSTMFVQVSLVLLVTALAAHVSAIDKGRLRFKVSAK